MQVLITGGTGLIGGALSRSLAADGHQVTILTRNPGQDLPGESGVRKVAWDAVSPNGWANVIESVDAVVHLAGENLADGRWTDARKRRIRDSRVLSGQALVRAIEQAQSKPAVLVQSSAVGYYGPLGDAAIDESAPPGNDYLSQVCVEWEAATEAVEEMGVRRAIARTGVVLSLGGGALPRIVLPYKFYAGGKIGSGKQWWSWIHLDDEVRALRFLIENDKAAGPFNLTAPHPVPNNKFASAVGAAMGKPSMLPVPSPALSLLFGEMSTVLLDGQRAMPARLLEHGFEFRYPQLDGALKDLLA